MTQEVDLLSGVTADTLGEPSDGTLLISGAITPGVHADTVLTTDGTEVADGAVLTIGSQAYRIVTTMSQAYDIKRNGTAATTLANIKKALNATGTAGVEYFTGTLAHPDVVGVAIGATTLHITARVPGTAANAKVTTVTAGHLSLSAATLGAGTGGSTAGVAAETVSIGATTYSFVDVLSETNGAAAIVNQVLYGGTVAIALDNLKVAINAGATAGTNYSTGTTAHTQVTATTNTNTAQTVEALVVGTVGDSITTTETLAFGSWSGANLSGGVNSTASQNVMTVEGYDKIGVQFKAANITSGNGIFILKGTINGVDWITLPMLTIAANSNSQTLIRVLSVTLSSVGTALVFLDRHLALKAIRAEVDVTTDGEYSAHAVASN